MTTAEPPYEITEIDDQWSEILEICSTQPWDERFGVAVRSACSASGDFSFWKRRR